LIPRGVTRCAFRRLIRSMSISRAVVCRATRRAAGRAPQSTAWRVDVPVARSYSACGLGSEGTDLLVQLVKAEGADSGLYGAKITVAAVEELLPCWVTADATAAVATRRRKISEATGHQPYLFSAHPLAVRPSGIYDWREF
jgi:hypothetical protein